jgi:uncharacterized protein (TIGR02677 family)
LAGGLRADPVLSTGDGPDRTAGAAAADPETGRRLFRHVTAEEWRDYRRIMGVFAGTFFAEFTPDDVSAALAGTEPGLDGSVVAERLESLRRWGNLTVSSATGAPSSLADYYRRRNRYLITPAGQEVHEVVEGVLSRVDVVRDVTTGRLRQLLDALGALGRVDAATADPQQLADLVGAVFDPHAAFTSEITQFFAAINQWQSRYDLSAEELSFFARVLVDYVSERLEDVERTTRPLATAIRALQPALPVILERANRGLAGRLESAGLTGSVAVSERPGARMDDWVHLASWFVGEAGRPARMERLRGDAVAAVRTLTMNLTRLSRVGTGTSSRRADLLRLARFVRDAPSSEEAARLVNAAFGLYPSSHLGSLPADAHDPVGATTSWWDAPPALVPVSLRERGDTAARGAPTPLADRAGARRELQRRREQDNEASLRVDLELLATAPLDGCRLSGAALTRLEQLLGRALTQLRRGVDDHTVVDGALACRVRRTPGGATRVSSPEGTLTLRDLTVELQRRPPVGASPG